MTGKRLDRMFKFPLNYFSSASYYSIPAHIGNVKVLGFMRESKSWKGDINAHIEVKKGFEVGMCDFLSQQK